VIVERLEAQVRDALPRVALAGARTAATARCGPHEVEIVHRVDRNGRRVFDYVCDGARMERRTLLQLLCDEAACPQAQATRQRWRAFRGEAEPVPALPAPRPAARSGHLIDEIPVVAAGHRCAARPASFECLTPCPLRAHPPQVLRKPGWDLFEDGVWVAGGVDRSGGVARPRFTTVADAERWLASQRDVALGVLERLR
jgi:hypothetical protein